MLEEHVAFYLEKYLGTYVKGLSKEALKISAWQGNVELTNMQLKPEALNALKLPIKVKAGFLGSVKLKVPWSRLGKEPVLVLLDRIFVLAEPEMTTQSRGTVSIQEAKKQKIKETEQAMLDARFGEADKSEVNNSWLGSLISTIIGNLKLSITNIHIRYEDSESNVEHPFAAGLTLEKLAAVTVDEDGKETFIASGPLDRIQKAGELQGLAFYLDPDTKLWDAEKEWDKLRPEEWSKIFEPRIKIQTGDERSLKNSLISKGHYLLQPVGASARYIKLGSGDARTADKEIQKAIINLNDVTLSLSQAQYRDILKLVESVSAFRKRLQYAHYRPTSTARNDPRAWWKYAGRVTAEQIKRAGGRMSWEQVAKFSRLRKKYVSLYINCLQSNPEVTSIDDNEEIQKMERDLDVDVAVQWRMLAHSFVDKNRKDVNSRKQQKRGWWSSLWGNESSDDSSEARSLTEEDWSQINQVIGYQEGNESSILPGQDAPDMLHTVLEVFMQHNATKLVDEKGCSLIELSAEKLHCGTKLYREMKLINFKLGSYKLCSPEGLLAESETLQDAIGGDFTYMPLDKSVDWSLSTKALPCYITYLKSSINEVVEFFQSTSAVSQTVALETAAALQVTFDEVARSAQKQLNEALKQKPRFSLNLDIAAPKILVPSEFYPDGNRQSKLLLDLGHLALCTQEPNSSESEEERELYMHFKLGLSDVQMFLIDGKFDWREHYNVSSNNPGRLKFQDSNSHLPVLERCGITMALQQICVPHPVYPSTRLAVKLPSLGFHFSPARYHRLMQIVKVFQDSSSDESENSVKPWDPADFEGEVSVLNWKGVGNREAVWLRRHVALAGPFVYVLDAPSSSSFKRRVSLIGKQVIPVSPEFIGGVENVLAVSDVGQFNSKVAESANTLLLRFNNEDSRESWRGRLQGAIYRFAAPGAVSGIFASGNKHDAEKGDAGENPVMNAADKEDFFLIGALDELKIVISSGPMGKKNTNELLLLTKEHPLLELRALGTKVEFVMKKFDMSVGAVLQALELEDKFSCKGPNQPCYLARSDILVPKTYGTPESNGLHQGGHEGSKTKKHGKKLTESREMFFDTEDDLGDAHSNDSSPHNRHLSRNNSGFYDAEDFSNTADSEDDTLNFKHIPGLLPELDIGKKEGLKMELQENFVKAQVILFSLDSPAYRNVDKQIIVSLATLSFFCIRPTIMALLSFSDSITADVTSHPQQPETPKKAIEDKSPNSSETDDSGGSEPAYDRKDSVVKGLLGTGKDRVLFSLLLNMHRAMIILNTDDGVQFASLAQEELSSEIQVFPSSFGITASLGNLRITDDSLDSKHPYSFICDTRNPGSNSFIQLEFFSFNKDDNDYEGYEYSLFGKLSEVRFVYLNRFIQEISSYFMGLVPQTPGYIVKIDNRVTEVEKFFTQSEVEGSPGIKLDVSLTKPIIIMPRETNSQDFLELDILQVEVKNSLEWIGGDKDTSGAIRLDNIVLHIEDIHMSVGMRGKLGEGIIKKANGLSLRVTRSLRDLWHQVPAVQACITIEELKADLSAKEYQVITECALSNISEKANLPPPVKLPDASEKGESSKGEKDDTALPKQEPELDRKKDKSSKENVKDENKKEGTWTTILVTACIEMVELSLFKGSARDQALATAQVSGVWVAYKANSVEEANVMASLESLSVKDDREGTEPVLQYMIGKADDVDYFVSDRLLSEPRDDHLGCRSPVTMLVMDAKLSSSVQMVSLRIQQPKLLVAVDFLLAIAEFFVPSISTIISDPEDTSEETINFKEGIYLDQPVFKQQSMECIISPKRPLVANNFGVDDYIYDGRSNSLRLQNESGKDLDGTPEAPLIIIGSGKRLRFKNVIIQGGDLLDSCILLGVSSSYSLLEADGVFLKSFYENSVNETSSMGSDQDDEVAQESKDSDAKEIMFDLQAIGPELTFYDSMGGNMMRQIAERLIRAKMDVFSRFVMKGNDMELNAKVNGLTVEASSGLIVVEPVDAEVKYSSVSGKQDFHVVLSEILMNMSFSVLQLVLKLQEDISSFLRITTKQATVQCFQFDKIWNDETNSIEQQITFWRPRAPPGFAVLGDCVTPSDEPLAKGVLALNMSLTWFKRPVRFDKVWSLAEQKQRHGLKSCSIWMPVPPPGYVAFGCVVTEGTEPPVLSSVVCILERVATSCSVKDCIFAPHLKMTNDDDALSIWRVENSVSSFFIASRPGDLAEKVPYELLHVAKSRGFPKFQRSEGSSVHEISTIEGDSSQAGDPETQPNVSRPLIVGHICESVAGFKLVWWNKNADSNFERISIWRPILPSGCVLLGDIAVRGYEPPGVGVVFRDQHDGKWLKKPLYFEEIGHVKRQRLVDKVSFWIPIAPAGYSALGCIAAVGDSPDQGLLESVGCVKNDLLVQTQFSSKLWDNGKYRGASEVISIWLVNNAAHTFIAEKGLKPPSKRLALSVADDNKASQPDNLVVDAEVNALSIIIYDDFRGLMVPLLNLSLSGVNASSHGRMDRLSSTLNFSLSVHTYNGKCYAWEPLVEPFDGFVRHYYKQGSSPLEASGSESRMKVVATSSVNANISVINLNMMLEAYASWNKLSELMEASKNLSLAGHASPPRGKKPALDFRRKKKFQVIHHNKLAQDLLIRSMDMNGQPNVVLLPSGQSASLQLPTSSNILDPGIKGNVKASRLVTILIGYAKLDHKGEYGEQRYMATVCIFPQSQTADRRQLEQQSARTRCVRPMPESNNETRFVQWNEVFSFEVEHEEACVVEVLVTELAGGSAVGFCSFPLSAELDGAAKTNSDNESKPVCKFEMKSKTLTPPTNSKEHTSNSECSGDISYAIHFSSNAQEKEAIPSNPSENLNLRPGVIQVSYKSEDCWTDIGLNYAARASCWRLGHDTIATETILDDENKQIVFRSLVVVVNGADFPVDVALSVHSSSGTVSSSDRRLTENDPTSHGCGDSMIASTSVLDQGGIRPLDLSATDEIFENERYQPMLGWGHTWPGHFLPTDPRHWSNYNYTCSVQEFPDAKLPLGWEWKGNWEVDKTEAGDEDGWSYGFDFKTLRWPASTHAKGTTSFVRRRRWIHLREKVDTFGSNPMSLGTLQPLESTPVPIASLRSSNPDYRLQIRPHGSNGETYQWSDMVLSKGQTEPRLKWQSVPELSLRSLIEAEELLCCAKEESNSDQIKNVWCVLDVQSKEIGMNSQLDALKDWRIVITAPLTLYNYLPVSSEYSVLEKVPVGTGMVVRERGVIGPGEEAQVFHADIRKALYLSWIPQGGWQPEDVPALICHPHKQSSKHITLKNFSTGRVLQVFIDQCPDGKEVVAKRLRFFVSCWLDIKKLPPLHCKFVESKEQKKLHVRLGSKSSSPEKILEFVQDEEMSGEYAMVSTFNMEKMGISIALAESDKACFEPSSPLNLLSHADEDLELKALNETGSHYYKVLVSTKLCPYQSVPTKVLLLRPFMTFTNRLGEPIYLNQSSNEEPKILRPTDWRITFPVPVTGDIEMLQVRLNDTGWCLPLKIKQEETLHIAMRTGSSRKHIRVEVRGFEEGSRFLVVFRKGSPEGPYRLENCLTHTEIQYRQQGLGDDAWQFLNPCSAQLYAWENPCGELFLEVLTTEKSISSSESFDINKLGNHYPCEKGLSRSFYCQVLELSSSGKVVRFCEARKRIMQSTNTEENEPTEEESHTKPVGPYQLLTVEATESSSSSKFEVQLELDQFGLSVIDVKLRELLYLCMKNLSFSYATGYASKARRMDFLLGYLQLDNQLPLSVLPELLVPEEKHNKQDHVLKMSVTISDQAPDATEVYPYIGVNVTQSSWRVNIHEPIIWAIMDFYNELHLDQLSGGSDVGQVDPEVRIDLIDISEVRVKITIETAPRQRPRGVLGIWSPIVTTLGNTSKMPIHLRPVVHVNRYIRKSAIGTAITGRLRRDLIHNPLMLLSGVDVLGMTSSTLATLSETVAGLSSDGKFLQLRSKQDRSRRISGVSDGLVQGTEAIAQGVAFGVSGVIRKPIEKAKEGGFIGFIQGLGKAAIGIVMEPMSGVLDFVSLTVNGVGASCSKCFEFFEREQSFRRVRLPRAVPPDGVLCCYDEKAAAGQAIFQLAEGRGRFFDGVFFKEPSKFAWSDFYVDHFNVVNHKIVVITNRRVMLLQHRKSRKMAGVHIEASTIVWDVPWGNVLALEMACTANDQDPVYVILHLRNTTAAFAQLIKCSLSNSDDGITQAKTILVSISKSWKTYGLSGNNILQLASKRHPRVAHAVPSTSRRSSEATRMSTDDSENQSDPGTLSIGQGRQNGDTQEIFNFKEIWTSEQVVGTQCTLCVETVASKDNIITIWRPIVPEGYVAVGDIARVGKHPPYISMSYKNKEHRFAQPTGFDLVWRSWKEGYIDPVSIWMPKAPNGYVAVGCVAVNAFAEPEVDCVWCVHSSFAEDAFFEDQELWHAAGNSAWGCFLYPIASEALTCMAFRQTDQRVAVQPKKVMCKQTM